MPSESEVDAILSRHSAWLFRQPSVCGMGVERDGDGEFVIVIYLDADSANVGQEIPASMQDVSLQQVRSGPFYAL